MVSRRGFLGRAVAAMTGMLTALPVLNGKTAASEEQVLFICDEASGLPEDSLPKYTGDPPYLIHTIPPGTFSRLPLVSGDQLVWVSE